MKKLKVRYLLLHTFEICGSNILRRENLFKISLHRVPDEDIGPIVFVTRRLGMSPPSHLISPLAFSEVRIFLILYSVFLKGVPFLFSSFHSSIAKL